MRLRVYFFLLAFVAGAGLWSWQRQTVALDGARAALQNRIELPHEELPVREHPNEGVLPGAKPPAAPSLELLRLRSEVTLLRQELESPPSVAAVKKQQADDWALVHSGPKPSGQSGFLHFTNLINAGSATPEAAFQSFHFAMRNQTREPMNPARTKEIWNVPDDYDDPSAKYSIDIGEGMGREIGYRIFSEERIATNQVRLLIDYELPDGSSHRREKVLVEKDGRWRLQPVSVTRQP